MFAKAAHLNFQLVKRDAIAASFVVKCLNSLCERLTQRFAGEGVGNSRLYRKMDKEMFDVEQCTFRCLPDRKASSTPGWKPTAMPLALTRFESIQRADGRRQPGEDALFDGLSTICLPAPV